MKVSVITTDEQISLNVQPGLTLLDHLKHNEVYVSSICGGVGTCHKCRVKIENGFLPIRDIDHKAFSSEELKEGWRLSCQSRPRINCTIRVPSVENLRLQPRTLLRDITLYDPVIVCDLGSTGVVVGIGDGYDAVSIEVHLLNKQIRYGADVMTRLHSAQRFGVKALQDSLYKTLRQCLKVLEEKDPENYSKAVKKPIICSGNSAMVSFLQNFDITPLAVSPFQPEHTKKTQSHLDSLIIETPPLLGGFIGADTTAVLAYMFDLKIPTPYMMIDIGTNTEIVFLTSDGKIIFTSTPAGPAFEGGSITKGMRAEPGAISKLKYENNEWHFETIGHDTPKGICGSGLIDAIAQGLKNKLIEQDGFLKESSLQFCERVYLTIDDIREFQLAKSAIRTAVDMLIDRANEKPQKIYLAGNFAENLNQDSIKLIGLLPPDIPMETIGNGSFKGSFTLATKPYIVCNQFYEHVDSKKQHIELALQDDFQERFVHHLNFHEIEYESKLTQ